MFTFYLEAVSVVNNKNMDYTGGSNKDNNLAVQFTQKDYDAIQVVGMISEFSLVLRYSVLLDLKVFINSIQIC